MNYSDYGFNRHIDLEKNKNTVDRIKKRRKGVEKREKGAKAVVGIRVLPQGLPENSLSLAGGK